ncbi:hypothetical protein EST38_g12339 [Candolleomyces aberdarensis]|uniref:Uncharacterized protein n=1 Tax=Candolleomyces aberdarensis TaxID=2316362 RepID=A0A4Q2D2N7_9AGAR|nr:hypothetical protein EST38_g12339 [Candolleomyces aberdarensis]
MNKRNYGNPEGLPPRLRRKMNKYCRLFQVSTPANAFIGGSTQPVVNDNSANPALQAQERIQLPPNFNHGGHYELTTVTANKSIATGHLSILSVMRFAVCSYRRCWAGNDLGFSATVKTLATSTRHRVTYQFQPPGPRRFVDDVIPHSCGRLVAMGEYAFIEINPFSFTRSPGATPTTTTECEQLVLG